MSDGHGWYQATDADISPEIFADREQAVEAA